MSKHVHINTAGEHITFTQVSEKRVEVEGIHDPKMGINKKGQLSVIKPHGGPELRSGMLLKEFKLPGRIDHMMVHPNKFIIILT